ncbi:MAG: hypothetical protein H7A25_09175 [Leptospiraceae bacterium]|nr:hypothetical protein [Leptospiraceae bacterium]MCP5500061.1 hypothetical protein [Leptospiraceae bacterium]
MRILILFILLLTNLLAESKDPALKFKEGIPDKAKRILDFKKEPKQACLLLSYKGKEEDYAVFYDKNGQDFYIHYRRNKFDREAEKKLIGLQKGLSYIISARLTAYFVYKSGVHTFPAPQKKELSLVSEEERKEASNVPILEPGSISDCSNEGELQRYKGFEFPYKDKFFQPIHPSELLF